MWCLFAPPCSNIAISSCRNREHDSDTFWKFLWLRIRCAVTLVSQLRFVLPKCISFARWWCKKERAITDSLSFLKVKFISKAFYPFPSYCSLQPLIKSQLHSFPIPYSFKKKKKKSDIINRSVLAACKISPMSQFFHFTFPIL